MQLGQKVDSKLPDFKEDAIHLKKFGYTLVKACISTEYIEHAAKELYAEYRSVGPLPWRGGGKWFGHVNYSAAPLNPIVREIASSSRIEGIIQEAIGADYRLIGFGGNVNLPGSRSQPTHVDSFRATDPAYIIIQIPLGEVTHENGGIELWPRTHREKLTVPGFNAVRRTSIRLTSSPGDVLIRFSNLWHRALPNCDTEPRFTISLFLSTRYRDLLPVKVSTEQQSALMQFRLPVSSIAGEELKTRFWPNYFPPDLKGNLLELTWMLAPRVYTVLRRVKHLRSGQPLWCTE